MIPFALFLLFHCIHFLVSSFLLCTQNMGIFKILSLYRLLFIGLCAHKNKVSAGSKRVMAALLLSVIIAHISWCSVVCVCAIFLEYIEILATFLSFLELFFACI